MTDNLTAIEAELSRLQVEFPRIDVAAEYRRACRKYRRPVELGWLRMAWLPRCRPAKRRSRAALESAVRTEVFAAASASVAPSAWPAWFARVFPQLDPLPWSAAPIDIRLRFVRESSAEGKESIKPAA